MIRNTEEICSGVATSKSGRGATAKDHFSSRQEGGGFRQWCAVCTDGTLNGLPHCWKANINIDFRALI